MRNAQGNTLSGVAMHYPLWPNVSVAVRVVQNNPCAHVRCEITASVLNGTCVNDILTLSLLLLSHAT